MSRSSAPVILSGSGAPAPGRPGVITPGALEEAAQRRMVTRSMWIGIWVWPAFLAVDAWMCFVAYPGAPIALFLASRVVVELGMVAIYRVSLRSDVRVPVLQASQNLAYTTAAVAIAIMATTLGGVRSAYMHGISLVALVRAAVIPEPWRRAWPAFAAIGGAFPAVMGAGAIVSASLRADWASTDALVVFISNYVFVISSAFIGMVTSHVVWQAQQQVYRARRVGRYRLQAPIGRGGMGEVWLAWDLSLLRNVALKLLRVTTDAGPDMVARFEREALAASRLQSPHVIQIFDYGASDDGLYYIAMEYLNGMDLQTLVEEHGPVPPARAASFVMQACLALEVAHEAGVIHRDVKPNNLFLVRAGDGEDFIKLLDFGVVRFREPVATNLTWTGMVIGTPVYVAPELWSGAPADERSDLYSIGVTLYFLLSGRLPFGGVPATPQAPPVELAPLFDDNATLAQREMEGLVRRCLARDPTHRMASAHDMHHALLDLLPALDQAGPPGS